MTGKMYWWRIVGLTSLIFFGGLTVSNAQMNFELTLPLGLEREKLVIPKDNPLTEDKVKLGKFLFFDKRLSANNTIACANCHNTSLGIYRWPAGFNRHLPPTRGKKCTDRS